jgi:hypothetical protein
VQESGPEAIGGRAQDGALAAVHQVGLHGIAIVVAHEMKGTVRDQQIELERQRHAEPARLSQRGVGGDDDLPDELTGRVRRLQREGQHVRPPADPAIARVHAPDLGVVHHRDLDGAGRPPDGDQRAHGGPGQTGNGDRDATLAVVDGRRHQLAPVVASSSRAGGAAAGAREAAVRASWAP